MADPGVERWKQRQRFYVWHYTEGGRNYPGWHFTATPSGCEELLVLFGLMTDAKWPAKKALNISPPSQEILGVPNNRGGAAAWTSVDKLILKYPKASVAESHWTMAKSGRVLTLEMGEAWLDKLANSIRRLPEGHDDYSIGLDSNRDKIDECLWFWSFPRTHAQ